MHDLRAPDAVSINYLRSKPLLAGVLASDSALPRIFTPRSTPRTKASEVILQESFITRTAQAMTSEVFKFRFGVMEHVWLSSDVTATG